MYNRITRGRLAAMKANNDIGLMTQERMGGNNSSGGSVSHSTISTHDANDKDQNNKGPSQEMPALPNVRKVAGVVTGDRAGSIVDMSHMFESQGQPEIDIVLGKGSMILLILLFSL